MAPFIEVCFLATIVGGFLVNRAESGGFGDQLAKYCPPNQVLTVRSVTDKFLTMSCAQPLVCDTLQPCLGNAPGACALKGGYVRTAREIKNLHGAVNTNCCQYPKPPQEDEMYESCSTIPIVYDPRSSRRGNSQQIDIYPANQLPPFGDAKLMIKRIDRIPNGYAFMACTLRCTRTSTTSTSTYTPPTLPDDVLTDELIVKYLNEIQSGGGGGGGGRGGSGEGSRGHRGHRKHGSEEEEDNRSHNNHRKQGSEEDDKSERSRNHNSGEEPELSALSSNCFPGDVKVRTRDGEKEMKHLKIGDWIATGSDTFGPHTFEKIIMFSHRDPHQKATFLKLETQSGHAIRLTGDHLLPIVPCDFDLEAASNPKINHFMQPAQNAKPGDCLIVQDHGRRNSNLEQITTLSNYTDSGIYTPITPSGTLIVDSIRASCHVASGAIAHTAQIIIYQLLVPLQRVLECVSVWLLPTGNQDLVNIPKILELAKYAHTYISLNA